MSRINAGELFPDFKAPSTFSAEDSISKIAGGKPLMLVVLRYIGCPSCRYDVHALQENYEKFAAKGVKIAVVMQSTVESMKNALAEEPLSFPILSDPEYKIYNALEIAPAADMKGLMGDEASMKKFAAKREKINALGYTHGAFEGIEEQLPAFFYLNADRTVKYAHYASGIGDMPTADEMLAMI